MMEILLDQSKLNKAILDFTKGKTTGNYVRNDLVDWDNDTKLRFNSAYFEANVQTLNLLFTDPSLDKKITAAQQIFTEEYLPALVKNAKTSDELGRVVSNIKVKIAELSPQPGPTDISHFVADHPYSFFAMVATATAISAIIGIELSK